MRAKGGVRVELAEIKRNQVTGGQQEEAEGEEGGEKRKQLRRRAGELGEKGEGKVQEESSKKTNMNANAKTMEGNKRQNVQVVRRKKSSTTNNWKEEKKKARESFRKMRLASQGGNMSCNLFI